MQATEAVPIACRGLRLVLKDIMGLIPIDILSIPLHFRQKVALLGRNTSIKRPETLPSDLPGGGK